MRKNSGAIKKVFETVSLGAPEKAVGFVLWRLVHRYMREVDRALTPLDLTHLQFMTLALTAWIGRSGEPVTQSQVSKHGDMHPMQVSLMLKVLEQKGMISRTRSASDVRSKDLSVTVEGVSVLRKALPIVVKVQQDLFGDLADVDGAFLKTLLALDGSTSPDSSSKGSAAL